MNWTQRKPRRHGNQIKRKYYQDASKSNGNNFSNNRDVIKKKKKKMMMMMKKKKKKKPVTVGSLIYLDAICLLAGRRRPDGRR